jgi:uncharacterized membrane protein YGL010W
MKTLLDQLANYAAYHRERRNIATHFVGIPMIVLSIAVLLSRPVLLHVGGFPLAPILPVTLLSILFYLRLDARFGVTMAILLGLACWAGARIAAMPTTEWLVLGIGLFVVGWIIQFIGHIFEGRKPAFVDDLVGLLIGPLFVVAEAGFAFGLRADLNAQIEERVGPTRIGRAARTA